MTCSPRRKHEHIISTTTTTSNSLPPNLSSNSTAHLNTLLLLLSPQSTHHWNIYPDTSTVTEFNKIFLRLTAWERFMRSFLQFCTHSLFSSSRQHTQSIKTSLISVSKNTKWYLVSTDCETLSNPFCVAHNYYLGENVPAHQGHQRLTAVFT